MSNNSFAPFLKLYGSFIVRNIATPKKVVRIFNYPIISGETRDLLQIPGVAESDIRSSLLKGELLHKILSNEIQVINSDIDLLQFNISQRTLLENAGITEGLQIDSTQMLYRKYEDIQLVGVVDDINTIFTIPSGKFIQNSIYKIIVYKNGVKQFYLDDYLIAESGGVGTGYDTIIFTVAPSTTPTPIDVLTADYYLINN